MPSPREDLAPQSPDFLGLVGNELQIAVARNANLAYLMQQYRRAGVRHVRVALDWASIEAEPGRFDWGYADLRVGAIANSGLRALGILGNTPRWASSCPDATAPNGTPLFPICIAADLDTYREYVRRTVRRYGGPGTAQIRDWEIRVESNPLDPNSSTYGVEEYVAEANAAFDVIRQEDPGARIWTGEYAFGRFNLEAGLAWSDFVLRHARFDVHSIHHFNSPAQVRDITGLVRQRMDSLGLGAIPLAVTAMNVFVPDPASYTEAQQAASLRALYLAAQEGGATFAMWFAGTQWPDLQDKKYGVFRYNFNVNNRVVPRRAYTTLSELWKVLPKPRPPRAVAYGCLGVSSNPCTPVNGLAQVALHFYSTGVGKGRIQIREGSRVIFCGKSNRAGTRDITVPAGTERTLTLHAASNCGAGPLPGQPLARITIRALP